MCALIFMFIIICSNDSMVCLQKMYVAVVYNLTYSDDYYVHCIVFEQIVCISYVNKCVQCLNYTTYLLHDWLQ